MSRSWSSPAHLAGSDAAPCGCWRSSDAGSCDGTLRDGLATLVQECSDEPGEVLDLVADVTAEQAMGEVASAAVERFGRIDTWVGVAGVGVYGRAWDTPAREYETLMRTNWLGQVHGALAVLPELRRNP